MKKRIQAFGRDIAVDFGSSSVLIYARGKGIVLQEPSLVALEKQSGKPLCAGEAALELLGRAPGSAVSVRPLRHGVICDLPLAVRMLRDFLHKSGALGFFKPHLLLSVPAGVSEVEERVLMDAALQAGAKRVYLMKTPIAAAIGADLDGSKTEGQMILDIGGGTTDIAVISLGGIVESACIPVAGDQFDAAIVRYIRQNRALLIGEGAAEALKIEIGCVRAPASLYRTEVKGRSLDCGLPQTIPLSSEELLPPLQETAGKILEHVQALLERTPAELYSDIRNNGILMSGGGSLLRGLDQLIAEQSGIPVYHAKSPLTSVIDGLGATLEHPALLG